MMSKNLITDYEIFSHREDPNQNPGILKIPGDNNHRVGIFNLLKHYNLNFRFSEKSKKKLNLLFLYFCGDPNFKTEFIKYARMHGDFTKGIALIGKYAVQSMLINVFQAYTNSCVRRNGFFIVDAKMNFNIYHHKTICLIVKADDNLNHIQSILVKRQDEKQFLTHLVSEVEIPGLNHFNTIYIHENS